MSIRPIRTAIIGCGRVSRTAHYDAVASNDDFEFVAVCDIDKSRADEWAEKNKVKAYYSLDDLLANEDLDLISVNVPNALHPQLAKVAAQKGINVICEKPLGMRLDECDELIELCDTNNVRLFTVLQNRFNDTNQLLKRAIEKGRFGKLLSCHVTMRWHRGVPYYTEDNGWRGQREMAGGVFTNQAVHYVDTMAWLLGSEPSTAYASMDTQLRPVEVETHGSAIVNFENGVIGAFDLTALCYPDDIEGSITIMGETGTVKVGGKSMNKILEWTFADEDPEDDKQANEADYEPPTVYGFGHNEFYRRVGLVLRHGEDPSIVPDGREGRKSVAMLHALYTSADKGQVFDFAEIKG